VQWALDNADAEDRTPRLHEAAKDVQAALQDVLKALPGQRDIDHALNNVKAAQAHIESGSFAAEAPALGPADARMRFNEALTALDTAAAQLAAAAKLSPEQLATATIAYDAAFRNTMAMGEALCAAEPGSSQRDDLRTQLKSVTVCSTALLNSARNAIRNPSVPQTRTDLAAATNVLKEALDLLSAKVSLAGPGGRECAAAQRHLATLESELEGPVAWPAQLHGMTYTECLHALNKAAPALSAAVKTMGSAGHAGELESVCHAHPCAAPCRVLCCLRDVSSCLGLPCCAVQMGGAAQDAGQHMTDLVAAATQAAYLIGVSDPQSTPAVQGCMDAGLVLGPQAVIADACEALARPEATQADILDALSEIAKNTNALCAACKTASNATTSPTARQNFIAAARSIAATTQAVVPVCTALEAPLGGLWN
jgi:talin